MEDRDELYDLQTDPYELKNLADDPDFASFRALGKSQLITAMNESDDNSEDAQKLRLQLNLDSNNSILT